MAAESALVKQMTQNLGYKINKIYLNEAFSIIFIWWRILECPKT